MPQQQPLLSQDFGGGTGPEAPRSLWKWLSNEGSNNLDGVALIATHQAHDYMAATVAHSSASSSGTAHLKWTYRQLLHVVEDLAISCHTSGVKQGDTIAVFVNNNNAVEWTVLFWTAIRLGITFVPLDPLVTDRPEELENLFKTLNPSIVVVQDFKKAQKLEQHAEGVKIRFTCSPDGTGNSRWISLQNMPRADRANSPPVPEIIDPSSTALIMFTSGSTNLPKGCPVSVKGFISQTSQYHSLYGANFTAQTRHLISTMNFRPICYLACLNTWVAGGTVVFSHEGFDPENTMRTINDFAITHAWFVPAMINMLAASPAVLELPKPTTLQTISMSADAAFADVVNKGKDLLRPKRFTAGWGMSEGAPVFGFVRDEPQPVDPDSGTVGLGRALPGTNLKICKVDTQNPVLRGEHGELHISSAATITSYLQNRSAESFYDDEEGRKWFKTGDTAMMNSDGVVFVIGRTKDIIVCKGVNIVPAIVEDCLKQEFAVEAVVVGIPHEVYGEVAAAVLKQQLNSNDSEDPKKRMEEHVIKVLGKSQALEGGVIALAELGLEDWPYNSSNKIQKKDIVDKLIELPGGT